MIEKLTFPEAAKYLQISVSTLEHYVAGGYFRTINGKRIFVPKDYGFPKPFMRGGTRCFRRIDLDRWEQARASA